MSNIRLFNGIKFYSSITKKTKREANNWVTLRKENPKFKVKHRIVKTSNGYTVFTSSPK